MSMWILSIQLHLMVEKPLPAQNQVVRREHIAQYVELLKMKVGKSENAKTAKTFFQVVKRFEKFSLVSLVIETGRTHQIRFHMASIGCPLLGDSFYGDGPELGISRTALHAQQLTFTHPFCEKVMRIESEMPKDLSFLLR